MLISLLFFSFIFTVLHLTLHLPDWIVQTCCFSVLWVNYFLLSHSIFTQTPYEWSSRRSSWFWKNSMELPMHSPTRDNKNPWKAYIWYQYCYFCLEIRHNILMMLAIMSFCFYGKPLMMVFNSQYFPWNFQPFPWKIQQEFCMLP